MRKKNPTKELLWFYYYQINNNKRITYFLFLVVLVALFETISVGAAMPIISLFVNPDFIFSIKIFQNIFESFNISSIENYKFIILVFFISIVIISTFIKFIMMKFIISFTKKITSNVAANVFQSSVCNEYSQIIKNSSNLILAGITNKVDQFAGILYHYFNFISGLFLSVSIIIALFFLLNPIVVIAGMFFIALLYLIISISVKHFLLKNSSIAAIYGNLRIKTLQDCLGNIKNILLDGSELKYSQYFKNSDIKYRKAQARVELASHLPRPVLESILTVALTVIAYKLLQSNNSENLVIYFGVVVYAVQKLLPIFQGIYTSWSLIKGNQHFLFDLMNIILSKKKEKSILLENVNFENQIEFCNLKFRYDDNSNYVIDDFNFIIKKGEKIGVKGTSGKGKTTLVNLFTTLFYPTSGKIIVDKETVLSKTNSASWKSKIAFVPQDYLIVDDSIKNNIIFSLDNTIVDKNRLEFSLKISELFEYVNSLDRNIESMIGERGVNLSGGQRQRIAIARAIYRHKEILVFDEATSALDYETEKKIIQNIKKYMPSVTFLMITHREQIFVHVDRIINIDSHKIS